VWDKTVLEEAIAAHHLAAAEALARVQAGRHPPDTPETFAAAAAVLRTTPEKVWVDQLEDLGLLDAFGAALQAQGVGLDPPPRFADSVALDGLAVFAPRAKSFRCRVQVNDAVAGTGCLIGPSLVLTAWHVVAVGAPGAPQEPAPRIRVVLADRSEQDVVVPPRFASLCGDGEWTGSAPRADAEVEGRNDVAVLVMSRPAAAHLGHVELPAAARQTASRSSVFLVHYPEGLDEGLGTGHLSKIRNVTARWRHDIETAAGSSGGPCFDERLEMAGLHQGKWKGGGRLVPIARFLADLAPLVADDVAPTTLWSLDGSDDALVIGRDLFFQAVAAAGADDSRVRGLRIKRNDPAGPTTGLAFSAEMLGRVLQRRGPEHTVVRVAFDRLVPDLVDDLRERVVAAGLPLPEIAPAPAVAPGAAAPEGAARDRAALLAVAVDAAAARAGRTVWFFFDNPSVALSEPARLALDGFVAAALRRPRLRLVVAGFETVALPGQEFPAPPAPGAGSPGLVVEFLGGFRRTDVVDVLTRATEDLLGAPENPAVVEAFADVALQGLASFNGLFAADDLPTVAERLRPALDTWRERRR
jgi:hypothetical protein